MVFNIKYFWLLLCVLGILFPFSQYPAYYEKYGMDFTPFTTAPWKDPATAFLQMDFIVTAVTAAAFIVYDGRKLKMKRLWLPLASIFLVGMSLALPLFLYLRESAFEDKK